MYALPIPMCFCFHRCLFFSILTWFFYIFYYFPTFEMRDFPTYIIFKLAKLELNLLATFGRGTELLTLAFKFIIIYAR